MSLGRTLFGAIALTAFLACSPVLGPEVDPVESVVGVASLVGANTAICITESGISHDVMVSATAAQVLCEQGIATFGKCDGGGL